MADTAKSDLASGVNYTMKHGVEPDHGARTGKVCHATALSKSTTTPAVSTLWQGGLFHPSSPRSLRYASLAMGLRAGGENALDQSS